MALGFLIPLAGLALGALGNLMNRRRSEQALRDSGISAHGEGVSETNQATVGQAAVEPVAETPKPTEVQPPSGTPGEGSPRNTEGPRGPRATQPATGPVQQNQGPDTPTPAPEDNSGLAARLGAESKAASIRKNKAQQAALSSAALK
jgi:hypothetical protein